MFVFFCIVKADSDFLHLPIGQHVHHDLGPQLEGITEGFTVGQHVGLPLGGHVILEHFLLFFCEGANQLIPGFHNLIQCLGILAVLLEAALTGMNVSQVKIF